MSRWWYIESLPRFGVQEIVYAEDVLEAFCEARRRTGFTGMLQSYTMDDKHTMDDSGPFLSRRAE